MKTSHVLNTIPSLLAVFMEAWSVQGGDGGQFLVYVGTYTTKTSEGIYAWRMDAASGELTSLGLAAKVQNPSFLAVEAKRHFIYSVNEVNSFGGKTGIGAVSAFSLDPKAEGKLTLLNQQSSGGGGPCHLTVDREGKCVLVANYGGGSVAVLPIKDDGSLGEASCVVQHSGTGANPKRQKGPHAHQILVAPSNRLALVCDLGLDKVMLYDFDSAKGSLAAHAPSFMETKPGAGPRHLAFHPNGRFVYLVNELDSTVSALTLDAEGGTLRAAQTIGTLPEGFTGENTTAGIEVHPKGGFLYASNRGHDSIAAFKIASDTGALSLVGLYPSGGKSPRCFAVDPTGQWMLVANQSSDCVAAFKIDPATGSLTRTEKTLEINSPTSVLFVPVPR